MTTSLNRGYTKIPVGKENIKQSTLIHKDYIIFDPLLADAFGVNVLLKLTDKFVIDEKHWNGNTYSNNKIKG
ncbi:hypothetical protein [Snodgrassella communis]|uniref:hypothetical protein n=1 Tax=Snodgrassella communis TaxID=2946699 RepID=UPI00286B3B68|nr:hypothetical protein [Snodgrassella communis]WMY91273.1 hypothetical protein PYG29_07495 [Snodgrassella communis]